MDLNVDPQAHRGTARLGTPGQRVRHQATITRTCYSLQANVKTAQGSQQPDREAQFRYLNAQAVAHMASGDPVISVDAKKKELVGDYKNNGVQRRPAGDPEPVLVHDFIDKDLGKTNPYGVYDVANNTGWVPVVCVR